MKKSKVKPKPKKKPKKKPRPVSFSKSGPTRADLLDAVLDAEEALNDANLAKVTAAAALQNAVDDDNIAREAYRANPGSATGEAWLEAADAKEAAEAVNNAATQDYNTARAAVVTARVTLDAYDAGVMIARPQ